MARDRHRRESLFSGGSGARKIVIWGCCMEEGSFGFIVAILVDLGDSSARGRAGNMQIRKGFTILIAEGAEHAIYLFLV